MNEIEDFINDLINEELEDESCYQFLENFKVVKILGKGAFGTVISGQNIKTQKNFAIKVPIL